MPSSGDKIRTLWNMSHYIVNDPRCILIVPPHFQSHSLSVFRTNPRRDEVVDTKHVPLSSSDGTGTGSSQGVQIYFPGLSQCWPSLPPLDWWWIRSYLDCLGGFPRLLKRPLHTHYIRSLVRRNERTNAGTSSMSKGFRFGEVACSFSSAPCSPSASFPCCRSSTEKREAASEMRKREWERQRERKRRIERKRWIWVFTAGKCTYHSSLRGLPPLFVSWSSQALPFQ